MLDFVGIFPPLIFNNQHWAQRDDELIVYRYFNITG